MPHTTDTGSDEDGEQDEERLLLAQLLVVRGDPRRSERSRRPPWRSSRDAAWARPETTRLSSASVKSGVNAPTGTALDRHRCRPRDEAPSAFLVRASPEPPRAHLHPFPRTTANDLAR